MYTTVKSLVSRQKIKKLIILFSKDALKYSKNRKCLLQNIYILNKRCYF